MLTRQRGWLWLCAVLVLGELWLNGATPLGRTLRLNGTFSLRLPLLWTRVQPPPADVLAALRRNWGSAATVTFSDRRAIDPGDAPWTDMLARQQRGMLAVMQGKDGRFRNQEPLQLAAGRFPEAVCLESDTDRRRILTCYVVGTPLIVSYLGTAAHEQDVKRMLASLR